MYPSYLLICVLLMLAAETLPAQTTVRFERNLFMVSGKPVFLQGWYGGTSVTELREMRAAGANVVIQYWTAVIDHFGRPPYTAAQYRLALKKFLGEVRTLGMYAIVDLPTQDIAGNHADSSFLNTIVRDSDIVRHPALLAWYQADEPEMHNTAFAFMKQRYAMVKRSDPAHPVCVVTTNLKEFDKRYPGGEGEFYDVLMSDSYPIARGDAVPSPNLSHWPVQPKAERALRESDDRGTNRAMIFVAQGYGYADRFGRANPHYEAKKWDRRNPEIAEIKYQTFSAAYFCQRDQQSRAVGNLGGVLYWDYDYADRKARANVNRFLQYMSLHQLGEVIIQPSASALWPSQQFPVQGFVRRFQDEYYVVAVNNSAETRESATIRIELPEEVCTSATELLLPLGQDRYLTLASGGKNRYVITDDFSARAVRVYKLSPVFIRISGPDRLRAQQSGLWNAVASCAGNGVTFEWAGRDAGDERRPWEPLGTGKSLSRQMGSKSLLLRCTVKLPSSGKKYSACWLVSKAS